ncbi:hypothetical protein [Streptomyces chiangmaiensis]|uniref:Uncharacterized protein n=1 Tax=Streptomyces chiangmaiensis TaxID=766497 RepID=A0ABU7FBK2_9ACTN|nr:hypothetical protein [Streptomyces chiangmaiensis]MED7820713.1 hypothetical protein [Streptomyces chiangmaiensis]
MSIDDAKRADRSVAPSEKNCPKIEKIKMGTDFPDCVPFREVFQRQGADGNPPAVFRNIAACLEKYDKRGVLFGFKSCRTPGI